MVAAPKKAPKVKVISRRFIHCKTTDHCFYTICGVAIHTVQ